MQHYKNRSSFEAFRQCQAKTKKPFVSHPRFYHPKGCPPQRAHLSPLSGIRQCTVKILFSPSVRRWMRMEDEGATADGMYVCTVMYAPDCNTVRERPKRENGDGRCHSIRAFPLPKHGRPMQSGGGACAHSYGEGGARRRSLRVAYQGFDKWEKDSYSPRTRPPV